MGGGGGWRGGREEGERETGERRQKGGEKGWEGVLGESAQLAEIPVENRIIV